MKLLIIFVFFHIQFSISQIFFNLNENQEGNSIYSEGNLMKSWLRFFSYEHNGISQLFPTKFEYNPAFSSQLNANNEEKDQWGSFNIPSDTSFFFILTKNTLYVANSRRVF